MKKRFPALLLALSLTLPLPSIAAEEDTDFADVSPDDWFAPYVEVCVEAGLMQGTGEGRFSPTKTLSGYECATLAMRLHNIVQGGDGSFEKAPKSWGYAVLSLPDGTTVREGYLGDENTWDWKRFSAGEDGHLGFLLDTEEKQAWGRSLDYQKVTLTLNEAGYAGELHLDGYNFLYFELVDDGDSLEGYDAIRDAQSAPAPSAWWRDAWYYAEQNGLTNLLMEGNNHRWDFAYRMAAVTDLPAINEITGLPDTGDPDALELYRAGVLTGSDEYGTFHGELTLTRAEAAAICARILRPDLRVHFTPAPLPTEGYTLTYLMDGEPDCGICFPVFFLGKQDIMLTLDGQQLPWPTEEGASVPSWGLEPQDNYCYLAYYDLSTKDPYDTKGGLIDRTGAWVVPPENGRTSQTYPVEGGFFTRTHRDNVEVWGLLDEQGQWVRELEQTEDGPLTTYPFKAAQPLRGIVPSSNAHYYVDDTGTPVSQAFNWVSPITDDGQGFVGLDGKIYRIQFTKDPSAET